MISSTEVSPAHLQCLSADSGVPIELPGDRAGWARIVIHGREYRAWVNEPEVSA